MSGFTGCIYICAKSNKFITAEFNSISLTPWKAKFVILLTDMPLCPNFSGFKTRFIVIVEDVNHCLIGLCLRDCSREEHFKTKVMVVLYIIISDGK